MHPFVSRLALPTALFMLCLTGLPSQAQAWPERPLKIITPSTPGGPPDVYARTLAEMLALELGQAVVVENSPVLGGMLAAQTMLRTPQDVHTLLVSTAGMMTIAPSAHPQSRYTSADFTPICQGVETGLVLVGNPSLGAHNFQELAHWLRTQTTLPSYSSYFPGSPAHFLGYQLGSALQVKMTHVPYRSSPAQIIDMLSGIAPLGFAQVATALPHVRAGKLVAFAVTSERRSPDFPDVPTVAEVGLRQLQTAVWFGLSAPRDLPEPIAQRLIAAHQKIVATADFRQRMATAGLAPSATVCGPAFAQKMKEESARWAQIVKATGFVAE
jgi:tripartite-type tricarboxylate transporter receptor subunit TctC